MKNLLKTLFVTLILLGITSCEKNDSTEDASQNSECILDFVDLNTYFGSAIYIDFIDDNNGWIIGKQYSPIKYVLINTSDGGNTWSIVDDDFQLDFDNGFVSGEALQFVTPTNGFKKLHNPTTPDKLRIQFTTDKGATWNDITNPFFDVNNNPEDISWAETFASNGMETIVFGKNDYDIFIIKIDNNTMQLTYSNRIDQNTYPVIIEEHAGIGYHFAADNTITAVVTESSNYSGDVKIAQSTDLGTTWTITSNVLDEGQFISSTWPDDNVGFVAVGFYSGAQNIYKTTDGGTNWEALPNSSQLPGFQMIRFADENNGIGITDFDFYTTNDGGSSWKQITCKDTNGYDYGAGFDEVISYPSVNNGWVSGRNKNINKIGIFHYTGN